MREGEGERGEGGKEREGGEGRRKGGYRKRENTQFHHKHFQSNSLIEEMPKFRAWY